MPIDVTSITRTCAICGEDFSVSLDPITGHILNSDIFYGGKIRFGVGQWAAYRYDGYDESKGEFILTRCNPLYKHYWYVFIDFLKTLFHRYTDVEYWECPKCNPNSTEYLGTRKDLDEWREG